MDQMREMINEHDSSQFENTQSRKALGEWQILKCQ